MYVSLLVDNSVMIVLFCEVRVGWNVAVITGVLNIILVVYIGGGMGVWNMGVSMR